MTRRATGLSRKPKHHFGIELSRLCGGQGICHEHHRTIERGQVDRVDAGKNPANAFRNFADIVGALGEIRVTEALQHRLECARGCSDRIVEFGTSPQLLQDAVEQHRIGRHQ